ncbi:MAG: signal recognition particle protein [Deltaproteobacteria bacterium]|nr:signal recognition particle protein [Deltaproteobacteria bacterium]
MFEGLTEKLERTFKNLRGFGKLSEKNIQDALREVRLALLEADVNFRVVRQFIDSVQQKALGQEVMDSLTPAQQVIKIVHDELVALMGGTAERLNLSGRPPVSIMLMGLQGSGKTTTAGKLARYLMQQGRHPILVPADIYRPAAIDQLAALSAQLNVPAYIPGDKETPEKICRNAVEQASRMGGDTILLDTAGRLHIDDTLMMELQSIKKSIRPGQTLFVADAMSGQDAVNVAASFHEQVGIDGVILTKLDGDARGGAALSIRAVIGVPILFVGVGEKLDALEIFHPDRMASRILGMGDMLSLIEKAQDVFDKKQAQQMEKKLRKMQFTLEDFRDQLRQIRKMGSLEDILGMIPGMGKMKGMRGMIPGEGELNKVEAIINSMTIKERHNPQILNASRRRRIAMGSGTTVQDINRLIKNYTQSMKLLKRMRQKNFRGMNKFLM